MDRLKDSLKLHIPDIFLAVLLALSISLALISSLLKSVNIINILFYTLTATLIYIFLFRNFLIFLICFSTTSSGLIIFIAFFDKYKIASRFIYYIEDTFLRVYNYMAGDGNIKGLETQIPIFICAIIALLTFFIIIKLRAYSFAMLLGGVIFAIQTILGYIVGFTPFYIFIAAVIMLYFYDINSQRHKKYGLKQRSSLLFFISVLPIVLIIFISAMNAPYSDKPVQWPWMDKKVSQFSNYIGQAYDDYKGKNDFFSLERTGFGKEGKLGGSVVVDNTEALRVSGTRPTYLKAIGRDVYTGSGWKNSFTDRKDLLDTEGYLADELYEMNFGLKFLNRQNNDSYKDFFTEDKYEITFLNINTKSIFIPAGLMGIDAKNIKITADANISTSMEVMKRKDFKYNVIAQAPRVESAAFKQALNNSYDGLYRSLMRRQINIYWQWDDTIQLPGTFYMPAFNKFINIADYAQRADNIRSTYTVLPNNLPQRVRDLAINITAGQRTNYDKAKVIEKYLSQSFPYTLQPGDTPKDRDFVDYFLFEQKQGYCVHYATAMAVMARVVGLPSRYVEGYMMPHNQNSDGSYTVTNQNAHSWVEIYFEGIGWVQFEPTAAFNQDFYSQEETTTPSSEEISTGETAPTPEPRKIMKEDETGTTNTVTQESGGKVQIILKVAVSIIIIVVIVLFVAVINTERYRHKIKKYKKLQSSQAMVKLYEELLNVMKKLGYGILDNETAIQYGKRIDGLFYIRPVSFEQISIDFTEARYGARQIDAKKLESYDKVYSRLLEIYPKEKGKLRYIIEHYFLGAI